MMNALLLGLLLLQLPPTEGSSKIWLGRTGEIEQYIATAEIARVAKIGNRMQEAIDRLVLRVGDAAVFVGTRKPKT
jgi:hypothetical protein